MQDNAQRNGVSDQIQTYLPDAFEPAEPYELVMANILSGPLVELADELQRHVAPGGTLVLSGLLTEQAGEVMQAYPSLTFQAPKSLDGWCRLVGQKA